MRAWDKHCPECGSDDVELDAVQLRALKKRCACCGHKWNEKRAPALLLEGGWVNGAALDAAGG